MLFRAGLVVALSSLAVLLGGISAAWRRACVHITRHVFHVTTLNLVHRMTPDFVARRHGWSLVLLFTSSLLALILLGWQLALVTLIATYASMEAVGFVFPSRSSAYYVDQIISDCKAMRSIALHFGDAEAARKHEIKLQLVLEAYGLDEKPLPAPTEA